MTLRSSRSPLPTLRSSQSEAEQRQREAEQQELATALAMSASVPMEDSQPASRPARTNPFASSEPEPTPAAAPVAVSTALPDAAANHTTTPAPDPRSYNPFFVPSPVIERKPIAPGSPELRGSPQPGGSPRLRPYRPKQEIVPVDVDADDCAAPDAEEEAPVAPAAPTSADAAPLDADVSVIQVPMATEDLPMRGTNDDDDEMEGPQPSYGAEQEHDDAAELASRAQTLLLGLTPTVAGDVGRVSNTPSGHSLHSAIMQTDSGAPVVTHSAPGSPKVTTLGDSAGTSTPNLTTTLPTEAELKAEAERMVQEARVSLKMEDGAW